MKLSAEKMLYTEYSILKAFVEDLMKDYKELCKTIEYEQKKSEFDYNSSDFKSKDDKFLIIFINLLWLFGWMSPQLFMCKGRQDISDKCFLNKEHFRDHVKHISRNDRKVFIYRQYMNILNTKNEEKSSDHDTVLTILKRSRNLNNIEEYVNDCGIFTISDYLYYYNQGLLNHPFLLQKKDSIHREINNFTDIRSYHRIEEKELKRIRNKNKTFEVFSSLGKLNTAERVKIYLMLENDLTEIIRTFIIFDNSYTEIDTNLPILLEKINHPFVTDLMLARFDIFYTANRVFHELQNNINMYAKLMEKGHWVNTHRFEGKVQDARKLADKLIAQMDKYKGILKRIFAYIKLADKGNAIVISITQEFLESMLAEAFVMLEDKDYTLTEFLKKGAVCYMLLLLEQHDDLYLIIQRGEKRKFYGMGINDYLENSLVGEKYPLSRLKQISDDKECYINVESFINKYYGGDEQSVNFECVESNLHKALSGFCGELVRYKKEHGGVEI